ncbi:MAG: hypothetical protein KME49_26260 [Brasilonema octagenarum HA4186-MV1]|nr:hypothetical protein [Brasilonema octagenarum HA4186-MV1]
MKRDIQGKFALKNDDYRSVRSLRLTDDTWRAWVNLCKSGQPLRLGGSTRVIFGFLSGETAQSHRIYSLDA